MGRSLRFLPSLAAAVVVGVSVAMGLGAAGWAPVPWVGAALCLVGLASATAAADLLPASSRVPLLASACLVALCALPPPFRMLPYATEVGALAAAVAVHAIAALLAPPGEGLRRRDLWLLLPYGGAAAVAARLAPWPDAALLAWPGLCGAAAGVLALVRLLRATSLVQEAVALRMVLTLIFAGAAAGAALLLVPEVPAMAASAAAVAVAEGVRRGAADAAAGETAFSPAEPVTTVLVAAAFGAIPLLLGHEAVSDLSAVALGGGIFGSLVTAPAIARRIAELRGRRARQRGEDIDLACDEAAFATEEALGLEEVAGGLGPLAAALPRGDLALTAFEDDRTALVRDGEVEVVEGKGHGPALAGLLEGRRRPMLAAHAVRRSVRETPLRPAADLVAEVSAELIIPLPCGESLEGALLVGRPRRGRLRGRRAARLERLGAVLGPRVRGGSLLGRGGRRIAELEARLASAEEEAERLTHRAERLAEENRVLRADRAGTAPREIVGRSPAMRRLLAELRRLAAEPAAVLVHGEPGAGRGLAARTLHDWSPRREGPLVRLDARSTPTEAQSEALRGLGGERGDRPGLVELADGGTLVVEELTALAAEAQSVLVRALAASEVHREAGLVARRVDVRLVATSAAAPAEALEGEGLLPELRDRLAASTVAVPPLRDRRGDIPQLATFFLERVARRHGLGSPEIGPEAMAALEGYDWPGNVRQLRAVVEHAGLEAAGKRVRPAHLPPLGGPPRPPVEEAPNAAAGPEAAQGEEDPLEGSLSEVERRALLRALERAKGNKSEAARLLGLKRTTFVDRLKKHDLS